VKVSTEKIPESQVVMTIEVEPERLEEARGKALRKLAPRAKVPGFRPGKAPDAMIRRYFGEERILDEALDALVPVVYREAVEADESIDPIARPQLVVETTEPLVVKATIPVRPTIELGDYKAVRVEPQPITVDEERVEQTLETLRRRAATLEPAEREVRWGDVVTIDVHSAAGERQFIDQQDAQVQLVEDHSIVMPGFQDPLIGHGKGETVEYDLPVPEEAEDDDLKGKDIHFSVTIKEIKEEVLPALDDEFVKQVGDGYETVDALRERVRADIRTYEEDQRANRYQDEILGKLVEQATIEFPPVMLEAEIDRIVHDQAGHIEEGRGLEQYLAALGKTEEQVREEFRPIADTRLRRSLILTEVSDAENIEVTPQDVEDEIDKMSASAGAQASRLRELFARAEGRESIRRSLLTRKTLERLVEFATQEHPKEAAPETGEATEAKKPRAKRAKAAAAEQPAVAIAEAASSEKPAASAEEPAEVTAEAAASADDTKDEAPEA
jgi:trigger factor